MTPAALPPAWDAGASAVGLIGVAATPARAFTDAGFRVESVPEVPSEADDRAAVLERLATCEAVVLTTPATLTPERGADTAALEAALRLVADAGRSGRLIVLAGRVPAGTVRSLAVPLLAGRPTLVAYSPDSATVDGPRIVGGLDPASAEAAAALLERIGPVARVGSLEAAELCGLLPAVAAECRSALGREWADVCASFGADPDEVLDAIGLSEFRPGLGGRSPAAALLAWGARHADATTRMGDAANGLNAATPAGIVGAVADALNDAGLPLRGSRVLVLGCAGTDAGEAEREVVERLAAKGAAVAWHAPGGRACPRPGVGNAPLDADVLAAQDCVLVLGGDPAHDYDWSAVVAAARRIVDACGATRHVRHARGTVVRA